MSTTRAYPGAKTNSGIIPFMVNEIPYHERYFELFAGTAQLFKKKKRATELNYLADSNGKVCDKLSKEFNGLVPVFNGNALHLLQEWEFTRKDFIYLDPPYPKSTRRSASALYTHEMLENEQHVPLLETIRGIDANIMISTSPNQLYSELLHDWRKLEFDTMGRTGPRVETIYMNYATPEFLHQYNMLGIDYIERQEKRRKVDRLAIKLNNLQPYELHLFMQQLIKKDAAAVQHFLTVSNTGKSK